jgi:hypothetical protein
MVALHAGLSKIARQINAKGTLMPLVDIQLIEGVFDKKQKERMIRNIADAMGRDRGRSHARRHLGARA